MPNPEPPGTPKPPAGPEPPSGPYISPRLREKLKETETGEPVERKSSPVFGWVMLAALFVIAGVLGFAIVKSQRDKAAAAERARIAAEAAAAESARVATARRDSMIAAARADSIAQVEAERQAAAEAARRAIESAPYGIVIGSYLTEGAARAELDRVAAGLDLETRVATATDRGATLYRAVLGPITGKSRAERRAGQLAASGAVKEARVIPMPRN